MREGIWWLLEKVVLLCHLEVTFNRWHFVFCSTAFFQCYVCHASVAVEIDRGRISEPTLCRNCNTNHSMVLIHNRSQYTDKQITKLQESPGKCRFIDT